MKRPLSLQTRVAIASGLAAAAGGGFSNILCMANTDPVNDNESVTRLMLRRAADAWPHGPRLFPIGALTMGLLNDDSVVRIDEGVTVTDIFPGAF